MDWSNLPMQSLQNYRSTYRLQIPSAYTRPHAELLYNSCELALRAPSMVLARRKTQDLKLYHKRQSQLAQETRRHTNGVSKPAKPLKGKDKRSAKTRDKTDTSQDNLATHDSIGAPPSPNSHPSQHDSNSISAERASASSRTASVDAAEALLDTIPPSLNQIDPEATVIGSTSVAALYTSIRKHFNAQQLNEPEAIARFSYVVRQQASSSASRTQSLAQRTGPLPPTTAELIANTASQAARTTSSTLSGLQSTFVTSAPGFATTGVLVPAPPKNTAHSAHSLSLPRTLAGNHIEVEGSYGDGRGWIMGTTSCGRQVRTSESVGGGGTFRLRFRPAVWGQEVVGNRAPT